MGHRSIHACLVRTRTSLTDANELVLGKGCADIDELVELVRARAPHEGQIASALPGLWMFRFDRPQGLCRHRSNAMWVGLAVQGKKLIRVGRRELVYDARSYLVMPGETDYEGQTIEATPDKPYLAIGLSLPPRLVVQVQLEIAEATAMHAREDHELAPAQAAPSGFTAPLDAPLIDGMCRLVRTLDDPIERRVLGPLIVRELVMRLLLSDAAAIMRQASLKQEEGERVRKAMAYIEANAEQRLTVEGVARQVAMSPSHFAHRFRAIASVSPMRYQKHVRLEHARELLLTEGERSSAIAARVGYASDAHFTRDFKRHFGLAPASYARAFEREGTVFAAFEGRRPAVPFAESSKKTAEAALGEVEAAR